VPAARHKRVDITRGPFDPGGQPDTRVGQPLELGFFAWNLRGGMAATKAALADPERTLDYWKWENSRKLIELAEHVGFDYQVPFGRWIGQGGATDFNGASLDFLASAAATAPITDRMPLFSTAHVTYKFHPLHIAKIGATIDHISNGRWGLNIVSGYSATEMAAFGMKDPIDHDIAYDMADEFTTLLKHLWHEQEPFDFEGDYYHCYGAVVKPGPSRNPRPVLMNAGTSPAGLEYGAKHADWIFTLTDFDHYADKVKDIHDRAAKYKRDVRVATMCWFLAEATDELAQEKFEELKAEIDTDAVRTFARSLTGGGSAWLEKSDDDEYGGVDKDTFERIAFGFFSPQIVGSYDTIAEKFRQLKETGLESLLISFYDPQKGLHQMQDEVIPRLKAMGLRT
jgi:FMNH2-dependent dimethyl sulfone monooxygenase